MVVSPAIRYVLCLCFWIVLTFKTDMATNYSATINDGSRFAVLAEQVGHDFDPETDYEGFELAGKRRRRNTSGHSFENVSVDNKLSIIFDELQYIKKGQEITQHMVKSAYELSKDSCTKLNQVANVTNKHTDILKIIAYKSIDLEARSRRNNIVVWGFLETQNENCFELIRNFLRANLDVDSNSMYITRAHRLGPRRQGVQVHKRPIIVNFRDYCDVELIFSKANLLKNTNFSIDRDMPKEISDARKRLWPQFKSLKSANPRAKVHIQYPARLICDRNVIQDEFPDWHEIMSKSRLVDLPYVDLVKTGPGPVILNSGVTHCSPNMANTQSCDISNIQSSDSNVTPTIHESMEVSNGHVDNTSGSRQKQSFSSKDLCEPSDVNELNITDVSTDFTDSPNIASQIIVSNTLDIQKSDSNASASQSLDNHTSVSQPSISRPSASQLSDNQKQSSKPSVSHKTISQQSVVETSSQQSSQPSIFKPYTLDNDVVRNDISSKQNESVPPTVLSTASVTFSGHASRQVVRAKDGQGRAHSNSQRAQRSLSRSVSRSRDRQSGQSQRDGDVGSSNTDCTSVTGGAQN